MYLQWFFISITVHQHISTLDIFLQLQHCCVRPHKSLHHIYDYSIQNVFTFNMVAVISKCCASQQRYIYALRCVRLIPISIKAVACKKINHITLIKYFTTRNNTIKNNKADKFIIIRNRDIYL